MADRIKLTPAELMTQASQMRTLEEEFSTLFSSVVVELNKVNGNWSPNLAHNFVGKITSAQTKFTHISQMLLDGAKVAEHSARSFESVDSALAKLYSGTADAISGAGNAVSGAVNSVVNAVDNINWSAVGDFFKEQWNGLKEDAKDAGDFLAWIEGKYDELPREAQGVLTVIGKWVLPGSLRKAYTATSEILQGEFTAESAWKLAKYIVKENKYISATMEAIEYTYETGAARYDEMYEEMKDQLLEGDLMGVAMDGAEGFIDTIIGGSIECLGGMAGGMVDGAIGKIPVVGNVIDEGTKYITGLITGGEEYSLGDLVDAGGKAISEGLDTVTDVITDTTDVITSGITEGAKVVGGAIVDGAKAAGEVAKAAGDAIADGVKAAGKAAGKTLDKVGSFIGNLF